MSATTRICHCKAERRTERPSKQEAGSRHHGNRPRKMASRMPQQISTAKLAATSGKINMKEKVLHSGPFCGDFFDEEGAGGEDKVVDFGQSPNFA